MTEKPYRGANCTRRSHTLPHGRKIQPGDNRLFACTCGAVMLGNGRATIRISVLEERFPQQERTVA